MSSSSDDGLESLVPLLELFKGDPRISKPQHAGWSGLDHDSAWKQEFLISDFPSIMGRDGHPRHLHWEEVMPPGAWSPGVLFQASNHI